jgi:hypothetical protein
MLSYWGTNDRPERFLHKESRMSSDNLGRAVKWQDDDGGWRTGREVTLPNSHAPVTFQGTYVDYEDYRLIRESCDGKLTWVLYAALQDWPDHNEWEDPKETTCEEFVIDGLSQLIGTTVRDY